MCIRDSSNDTDGDCILDGDEILWAATLSNVSASDALNLADADGDGADDNTVIGCKPELTTEPVDDQTENNTDNNTENNSTIVDLDSDNDGILNEFDYCPCLLYTSPSPRDTEVSRMPSSA